VTDTAPKLWLSRDPGQEDPRARINGASREEDNEVGEGGSGGPDLERALAVVAPEAGAVVDAPVGGELLDGVDRPAARRALLRGAAPRPRHPLGVAALLLRRPARDGRGGGSGRGRARGQKAEATATGGGVDDWRRW